MPYNSADNFQPPDSACAGGSGGYRLAARRLFVVASLADADRDEGIAALRRAGAQVAGRGSAKLQKAAGTAGNLKKQSVDAEKALSEASAARASAQNELADLTKQIGDAKLAISGAQEEASARTRDLQAVDAKLKEEDDRLAAAKSQIQALRAQQSRAQSEVDAAHAALLQAQAQVAAARTSSSPIVLIAMRPMLRKN